MALSDEDNGEPSYLPNEFDIQEINNKVLGFPKDTPPNITPQENRQILAFGTLEALLTTIQKYNEAFATILSTPHIDDYESVSPAFISLIDAGKDIRAIGEYLRHVQLLDDEWDSSPGVQLLLNPDTTIDPASIAIEAREEFKDKLEKEREEIARKKVIYEATERARKEKLEKAIREGIKAMMSFRTLVNEANSTTVTMTEGQPEAKDQQTPLEIQSSSQLTTVEDLVSDNEPENENSARKTARAASLNLNVNNTSSSISQRMVPSQEVVVEVPSPESLFTTAPKGGKRKRSGTAANKAKPQPKRRRIVDELS